MYPFTLYHATAKMARRYTFYAKDEEERQAWNAALVDGIGVRKARQEANMVRASFTLAQNDIDVCAQRVVLL